jgi:hypothetical protein
MGRPVASSRWHHHRYTLKDLPLNRAGVRTSRATIDFGQHVILKYDNVILPLLAIIRAIGEDGFPDVDLFQVL